ncbi:MAG: DUF1194 domain-containing protein [Pseudomonadota bacterium]
MKAWLCVLIVALAGQAAAQCRQALALGLDVSGSVDAREYRLQIDGVRYALGTGAVRQALTMLPGRPVALMVYEWSGPDDSAVLLPWTHITSERVLDAAIAQIGLATRRDATPGTALGRAMLDGAAFLQQRGDCDRLVLDISGDGKNNLGPRPPDVQAQIAARGITVNALVIGADAPSIGDTRQAEIAELSSYFRTQVITGPDAFVETALGFEDYGPALARKLERELQTLVFGALAPRGAQIRPNFPLRTQ